MNVCVLGDPNEPTTAYVGWLARQRGCNLLELPEAALGTGWDFDCDDDGVGTLRVGDRRVPWEDVDGVFVRLEARPPNPRLPSGEDRRASFSQERREGLQLLLERLSCTVINRPSSGCSNASRPCQMAELANAGFAVPRWIASNSPAAVRGFAGQTVGRVVWRPLSGPHPEVVRTVDERLLTQLEAGAGPVLVHELVPGADVSVHIAGRMAITSEVAASGPDRRLRLGGGCSGIPDGVLARCRSFAEASGLVLAGFAFRVTPERWLCLGMDPEPAFASCRSAYSLRIGAAVLDALTGPMPAATRAGATTAPRAQAV